MASQLVLFSWLSFFIRAELCHHLFMSLFQVSLFGNCFVDWLLVPFRDLSVDAGLPPHQYHIHPLPQHYQHYLTSPRMHHFPRNNASTQVVSRVTSSGSLHLTSIPGDRGWPVFACLTPAPRSSTRSETTRIPSCTCWLCRVSTPPATRLPSERATRFVPPRRPSPPQTHQSTLIYHCLLRDQCAGQASVCNRFLYFQLLWVSDASDDPAALNLKTFVFIWTGRSSFLRSSSMLLEAPDLIYILSKHATLCLLHLNILSHITFLFSYF